MTQAAAKLRIKYLAASAQQYSQIAPATSAHLMLQCDSVAASNDVSIKMSDSRRTCAACGTISVSGWTSRTSVVDPSRNKKGRPKPRNDSKGITDARTKVVMTECLVCRRSASSHLEHVAAHGSSRKQISTSKGALLKPTSTLGVTRPTDDGIQQPQASLLTNLASKRRARARKQSGLQAMLQKSKSADKEAPSPALDLMDFMKIA